MSNHAPHFPAAGVICPSIFDAQARPDLIQPLVLANLLSPSLWEIAARVEQQASTMVRQADDVSSLPSGLRQAQNRIDSWFEHLSPARTTELFGEIDLHKEAQRLGEASVAATVECLRAGMQARVQDGTLDAAAFQAIEVQLAKGHFPAYHYVTVDVVRANRRMLQQRRRAPKGLTSCLDEAALFAALTMALPTGTVDWVVVLAAPEHTTAFGHSTPGGAWWFYGKSSLLDSAAWQQVVEQCGGDAQASFDRHLGGMDRIVSIDGRFDLGTGFCEIPAAHLDEIISTLDRFFGCRLSALAAALQRLQPAPPSPLGPCFRALLGAGSLAAAQAHLCELAAGSDSAAYLAVLYAHRSLAMDDLSPYLEAARACSHATAQLAAELNAVDAAIAVVSALPGRESIFGNSERLAMPDETLRLGTGSERDRALLLQLLIENLPATVRNAIDGPVCVRFGADAAFAYIGSRCIDLRTMTDIPHALTQSLALRSFDFHARPQGSFPPLQRQGLLCLTSLLF